jgi:Saxitoxin biosynthesis operon protein SxtJ
MGTEIGKKSMSLINDVRGDLRALDCSEAGLVKFGRTVGGVFLLIATGVYLFRHVSAAMFVCAAAGSVLVLFSMTAPLLLRGVYRIWMGAAFTLGWIVSRAILALFFFVVITPVAFAARMTGKKFLNTDFKTGQQSYWIEKQHRSHYDKMS